MGMRWRSILRMSLSYFGPENSSSSAATSGGRPASFNSFDSSIFDTLDSSVLGTSMTSVFEMLRSSVMNMMAVWTRMCTSDAGSKDKVGLSGIWRGDKLLYLSPHHVRGHMRRQMTCDPPPGGKPASPPPSLYSKIQGIPTPCPMPRNPGYAGEIAG